MEKERNEQKGRKTKYWRDLVTFRDNVMQGCNHLPSPRRAREKMPWNDKKKRGKKGKKESVWSNMGMPAREWSKCRGWSRGNKVEREGKDNERRRREKWSVESARKRSQEGDEGKKRRDDIVLIWWQIRVRCGCLVLDEVRPPRRHQGTIYQAPLMLYI